MLPKLDGVKALQSVNSICDEPFGQEDIATQLNELPSIHGVSILIGNGHASTLAMKKKHKVDGVLVVNEPRPKVSKATLHNTRTYL